MARGGARVGAGRPRKNAVQPAKLATTAKPGTPAPAGKAVTPLEYMMAIVNDPEADAGRRDRMAVAAAPYLHPKSGEAGRKGELQAAADKAMTGVFATPPPPRLATVTPLRGGK